MPPGLIPGIIRAGAFAGIHHDHALLVLDHPAQDRQTWAPIWVEQYIGHAGHLRCVARPEVTAFDMYVTCLHDMDFHFRRRSFRLPHRASESIVGVFLSRPRFSDHIDRRSLFGWLLTIQAMEGSLRARQKGSFGLLPGLPTDDKQVGEHRDFGDRSGNGDGSIYPRAK